MVRCSSSLEVLAIRVDRTKALEAEFGRADSHVVVHHAYRGRLCALTVAGELEVSPQRASEEPDVAEYALIVIEHVHVGSRQALELARKLSMRGVVLVVSEHVEHGHPRCQTARKPQTIELGRDIAGQYDDVRIELGRLERGELEVQVRKYRDTHACSLAAENDAGQAG